MFRKNSNRLIKVLLIDPNQTHAYVLKEILSRCNHPTFRMEHSVRLEEGIARMERRGFDVVFVNPEFGEHYGLKCIQHVFQRSNGTPILILTNIDDEEMALQSVKEGAQDYLIIGKLSDQSVIRSIAYAMARQTHRTIRSSLIKQLEDMMEDDDG